MALALVFSSCGKEDDITDIAISDLRNTVWESDWINDNPIIDYDYVDVTKSKTTYYFTEGDTVIAETEYRSINSSVGTEKGKSYWYGIYSLNNSQLVITFFDDKGNRTDKITYTIKGNQIIWEYPYIYNKKRSFTSSDMEFTQAKKLYYLPVEQRLNINVETSITLFQNWQYYSDTRKYHISFFGFASVPKSAHAYERGIAKITTFITYSNGEILKKINIYPTPNANADEDESGYFSIYSSHPSTTIKMYSVIYDSRTNKSRQTATKTYSY